VCYEGDVSRVVDLCRIRLVVAGAPGAAAAVAAVAADGGVSIVRVKDCLSHLPSRSAARFLVPDPSPLRTARASECVGRGC
jgi:hypothetical protein